jgi:hypothetical protein
MDSNIVRTDPAPVEDGPHEGMYRVTLSGDIYLTPEELTTYDIDAGGEIEIVLPLLPDGSSNIVFSEGAIVSPPPQPRTCRALSTRG